MELRIVPVHAQGEEVPCIGGIGIGCDSNTIRNAGSQRVMGQIALRELSRRQEAKKNLLVCAVDSPLAPED